MGRTLVFFLLFTCLFMQGDLPAEEIAPTEEEKLLYLGEKAFAEQLYDLARDKLEQFLREFPESPEKQKAQDLLAKTLYHERDYTRSEAIFSSLIDRVEDIERRTEYTYWLGRARMKQNKFDEALTTFDSAIENGTETTLLAYIKIDKAACLFGIDRVEESFELIDAVISEYVNKDEGTFAQLEKCRFLLAQSEYSKARDGLLLLIDMKMPKELQSRMFYLLGETEFYLNNLEEAIAYYKKSLETGTYYDWFPETTYAIGWCHLKQGDHERALTIFDSLAKEHGGRYVGWKADLGAARALLLDQKSEKAVAILEDIITKGTENSLIAEAKYLLGDAAIAAKNYDRAIELFNTMVQDHPDSEFIADAYFGKGSAFYVKEEYEKSIVEFSAVLKHTKRPELVRAAVLRKADAYYEMREYIEALDEYRTAWEWSSELEEPELILLKMGWCYYKLEDYDSAIATFQNLAEKYSDSDFADDATYRLGSCYYRQGEFEKAIERYSDLKMKFPKSPLLDRVSYQIGACNYHLGYYDLARQGYEEIVENYPESILADRAAYEIGWCYYYDPGNTDKALPYFESYLEKRPSSAFAPEVFFWIGERFYNEGKFEKALAKFSELSQKYPESFLADEALYWSGRSGLEVGKTEEAIARFNELIEKFPDSEFAIDSAFHAAVSSLSQGKADESLKALLELRSTPGSEYLENDIRLSVAESYLKLNRLKEAFAEYRKLSECRDRKFKAWGFYGMGLTYKARNRYTEAISSFMEVAWSHSDEREVVSLSYLEAGDCYALLGKKREAIDRYVVIVEEKLPHAEEARERIEELKKKSMRIFD